MKIFQKIPRIKTTLPVPGTTFPSAEYFARVCCRAFSALYWSRGWGGGGWTGGGGHLMCTLRSFVCVCPVHNLCQCVRAFRCECATSRRCTDHGHDGTKTIMFLGIREIASLRMLLCVALRLFSLWYSCFCYPHNLFLPSLALDNNNARFRARARHAEYFNRMEEHLSRRRLVSLAIIIWPALITCTLSPSIYSYLLIAYRAFVDTNMHTQHTHYYWIFIHKSRSIEHTYLHWRTISGSRTLPGRGHMSYNEINVSIVNFVEHVCICYRWFFP